MKFACKTYFDITATGVTGHYKSSRIPFQNQAGEVITNETEWNKSRNQQRNWETITQLISMRTQIFELREPTVENQEWYFEFEVETQDVYGPADNPVEVLVSDAANVPMLTGLDNKEIEPVLIVNGPDQNIWFTTIPINT